MAILRCQHTSSTSYSGNRSQEWLSLTQLGRMFGVSAIFTGKLLVSAGLRTADGEPTAKAMAAGLVRRQHTSHRHQLLWQRQGCSSILESHGVKQQDQPNLISLWADLLSALQQGCPWVCVSVEEMATEIPHELVTPVNQELLQRGCDFQVTAPLLKKGAVHQPVFLPSPAGV